MKEKIEVFENNDKNRTLLETGEEVIGRCNLYSLTGYENKLS